MAASVTIVLITWNSASFLRRCAEGIRQQTVATSLVVIDNASSDDSLAILRHEFPEATVIRNDENRGFATAANQGIAAQASDFVLLLNPDVFLEPQYVASIIDAMAEEGSTCGSGTGTLIRAAGGGIAATGEIDSTGIEMTRSGRHFDRHARLPVAEAPASVNEVFGVSGAAAVYRRTFLQDVSVGPDQPFDPDFFAYREDADLSWRGRLFGWRAIHVPSARALHVRTVTPERRRSLPDVINMHSVKNRFLLRMKNQGRFLAIRDLAPTLLRDLAVIGASLTIERSSLPAFGWLWRHRSAIAAKRRLIQARRRVEERQLASWFR